MGRLILCLLLASPAWAAPSSDPKFDPRPLPIEHIYTGGWEHFVGGGVAVMDCDGDHYLDMFAAGGTVNAALLINVTDGAGADIRFEQGAIQPITGVTGAYPLDINSDGNQDLVVLRVGPNMILKGQGDCTFEDVTEDWGFQPGNAWSTAFSATWEQGQTWPTLAIGNYVDRDDPDGPFEACDTNELHRPKDSLDGPRYGSVTTLSPGHCALSMLFSDWNRQGVADLRVSNDRHYYVKDGAEQMWAMPDLTLRDGDGWDPISIWGMGIASEDITGDGLPEVVLTSMGDQLMQIATGEGYKAAPYEIGTYAQRPYQGDDGRPSTGWHAQFGDVNNDGFSDLFIAKGNVDQMPGMAIHDPNNLLVQDADGTFLEYGGKAGIGTTERSRGASLSDFNLDGLLDLVVVNRRAPLELYQNVTETSGHWLTIQPLQKGANPFAVGGWVEMRMGDKVISREITVGGGHASGQAAPVHFGLGPKTRADIRVIWPDGVTSRWVNMIVDQVGDLTRFGETFSIRYFKR